MGDPIIFSNTSTNAQGEFVLSNPINTNGLIEAPDSFPTVAHILQVAGQKYAGAPAFGTRVLHDRETTKDSSGRALEKLNLGEYQWVTYGQALARAKVIGSGLRAAGLKSGDNITIYMNTCAEWQLTAHAAAAMASPVVTIYATLGEEAMVYGMSQTTTHVVVTEATLLPQLSRVAKETASVTTVVYTGVADDAALAAFPSSIRLLTLAQVEHMGAETPTEPERVPAPDDTCVIMYTSGSTGLPKGVLLTHNNLMSAISGLEHALPPMISGEDVYLAFLPLAHILALIAELFFMYRGCGLGYGSPTTLTDSSPRVKAGCKGDIGALRPTYMACVPTIVDRIRQGVLARINASSAVVQKVFWGGFAVKAHAWEAGHSWAGYASGAGASIMDLLVFNKLKAVLGGRLKGLITGGAPLSMDSQKFITIVFGLPTLQGYGLTETCAMGTVGSIRQRGGYGHVGGPERCVLVKLVDWDEGGYHVADKDDPAVAHARGEICISGPCVAKGYYKMPEKTAEEFRTGPDGKIWFHTGDIGMVYTGSGALQIIDRKKDLVKLQQGEYVSLGKVESVLAGASCIEQICVHVDPLHSFCIALVVPLRAALLAAAQAKGLDTTQAYEALCKAPAVEALVLGFLQAAATTAKLQRFEVPAKITLLPDPWTPDTGLVTASLKLQRPSINKHFADVILATYDK